MKAPRLSKARMSDKAWQQAPSGSRTIARAMALETRAATKPLEAQLPAIVAAIGKAERRILRAVAAGDEARASKERAIVADLKVKAQIVASALARRSLKRDSIERDAFKAVKLAQG